MTVDELNTILPLTNLGEKSSEDYERAKLLIQSLNRFVAAGHAINLFIAVAGPELAVAQREFLVLSNSKVRIAVVDSAAIVPDLDRYDVSGYYKQQIIKLAFPRFAPKAHYFCLDADLVCVQPLHVDRLLAEQKSTLGILDPAPETYVKWLQVSAQVIGLPHDPARQCMTYAPALLSREIVRALWQTLESKYGLPWYTALMRHTDQGWSEYALYYLMACQRSLLETYHRPVPYGDPRGLVNYEYSFFDAEVAQRWNPAGAFKPGASEHFIVCNSGAGMSAAFVRDKIEPLLAQGPT